MKRPVIFSLVFFYIDHLWELSIQRVRRCRFHLATSKSVSQSQTVHQYIWKSFQHCIMAHIMSSFIFQFVKRPAVYCLVLKKVDPFFVQTKQLNVIHFKQIQRRTFHSSQFVLILYFTFEASNKSTGVFSTKSMWVSVQWKKWKSEKNLKIKDALWVWTFKHWKSQLLLTMMSNPFSTNRKYLCCQLKTFYMLNAQFWFLYTTFYNDNAPNVKHTMHYDCVKVWTNKYGWPEIHACILNNFTMQRFWQCIHGSFMM